MCRAIQISTEPPWARRSTNSGARQATASDGCDERRRDLLCGPGFDTRQVHHTPTPVEGVSLHLQLIPRTDMVLTAVNNGAGWSALYVDGNVVRQGRQATEAWSVAETFLDDSYDIDEYREAEATDEADMKRGRFPDTLHGFVEDPLWEIRYG